MQSQHSESRWTRWQRGQAMMEYWPTIPVSIAVMVAAGLIASAVNNAFLKTADALHRAGLNAEICNATTANNDGPDLAQMDDHSIQATSVVYDPDTNTTLVTYKVTSGSQPSISHWVLGIPKSVADNIIETSEAAEWTDSDPTTGIAGLKFDTGYEGGNSGGNSGGNGGGNGGGNSGGKNKGRVIHHTTNRRFFALQIAEESIDYRNISILLTGQYEFSAVTVTIKAGTQTYSSTISAPTQPAVSDTSSDPSDLLNIDSLHQGCAS